MRDIAKGIGLYVRIHKGKRHRYGKRTKDLYFVSVLKPINANQLCLRNFSSFEYGSKLRKVVKSRFKGFVYNLQVEEDESFIADGVVVHNCVMSLGFCIVAAESVGVPVSVVFV